MDLEFRNFQPGDEEGLAKVFNAAFQGLGGGFLRTPKTILWRYVNRPHGKAEEVQVAYDKETKQVVGSVYSTIESYHYNGKIVKIGSINDVATLPEYVGKGISKKLMQRAIQFFEQSGCVYSLLCADPKGHPRKKMYVPMGWQDFSPQNTCFGLANPYTICRYIPPFVIFFPALAFRYFLYRLIALQRQKRLAKQGIQFEILHPFTKAYKLGEIQQLLVFQKKHGPREFEGFIDMDLKEWLYYRWRPIQTGLWVSYVSVKYNGKVIGMGSFTRQWFYSSSMGLRMPLSFMRDFVIDTHCGLSSELKNEITTQFCQLLWIAASQRNSIALIYNSTPSAKFHLRGLKTGGFINLEATGTFMLKSMNPKNPNPPLTKKPLYISPGENFISP